MTKLEYAQWLQKQKNRVKIYIKNCVKTLKLLNELMALTRVELASLCKQNKPKSKYMISKIAEKYIVKILFLPVAHAQLNSIELIWSMLK